MICPLKACVAQIESIHPRPKFGTSQKFILLSNFSTLILTGFEIFFYRYNCFAEQPLTLTHLLGNFNLAQDLASKNINTNNKIEK